MKDHLNGKFSVLMIDIDQIVRTNELYYILNSILMLINLQSFNYHDTMFPHSQSWKIQFNFNRSLTNTLQLHSLYNDVNHIKQGLTP